MDVYHYACRQGRINESEAHQGKVVTARPSKRLARDVVLTKQVWERSQKTTILKHLRAHIKAKHGKGVGMPLPARCSSVLSATAQFAHV